VKRIIPELDYEKGSLIILMAGVGGLHFWKHEKPLGSRGEKGRKTAVGYFRYAEYY